MKDVEDGNVAYMNDGPNVYKIGPEGKFINFIKVNNRHPGEEWEININSYNLESGRHIMFKPGIDKEDLTEEERTVAIFRIYECLKKHVEKIIAIKMREQEEEIRKEVESYFKIEGFEKRIEKAKDFLHRSGREYIISACGSCIYGQIKPSSWETSQASSET